MTTPEALRDGAGREVRKAQRKEQRQRADVMATLDAAVTAAHAEVRAASQRERENCIVGGMSPRAVAAKLAYGRALSARAYVVRALAAQSAAGQEETK